MFIKRKLFSIALVVCITFPSYATDYQFSISAGYPFFLVPEISVLTQDKQQKWTFSYKEGLDDGFSLAYEHSITNNNRNTIGLVVGTIGIVDEDEVCDEINSTIACIVSNIFYEESVDGIGVSYSYYYNSMSSSGAFIKLEAGWGRSRDTEDSETVASIRVGYQF